MRSDSGFFSNWFIEYFVERDMHYITAARFYRPIKREVFYHKNWIRLHGGVGTAEWMDELPGWSRSRRMIAVRKRLDRYPKSSGKLLLLEGVGDRYRYSIFATNLDLPAQQVWNLISFCRKIPYNLDYRA